MNDIIKGKRGAKPGSKHRLGKCLPEGAKLVHVGTRIKPEALDRIKLQALLMKVSLSKHLRNIIENK